VAVTISGTAGTEKVASYRNARLSPSAVMRQQWFPAVRVITDRQCRLDGAVRTETPGRADRVSRLDDDKKLSARRCLVAELTPEPDIQEGCSRFALHAAYIPPSHWIYIVAATAETDS
jgi:hypothetical protein